MAVFCINHISALAFHLAKLLRFSGKSKEKMNCFGVVSKFG